MMEVTPSFIFKQPQYLYLPDTLCTYSHQRTHLRPTDTAMYLRVCVRIRIRRCIPSRSLGKYSIVPSIRLGRSFQYPLLEPRTTLCTACSVCLCPRDAANVVPPAFAGKNYERRSSFLLSCFTSFPTLS